MMTGCVNPYRGIDPIPHSSFPSAPFHADTEAHRCVLAHHTPTAHPAARTALRHSDDIPWRGCVSEIRWRSNYLATWTPCGARSSQPNAASSSATLSGGVTTPSRRGSACSRASRRPRAGHPHRMPPPQGLAPAAPRQPARHEIPATLNAASASWGDSTGAGGILSFFSISSPGSPSDAERARIEAKLDARKTWRRLDMVVLSRGGNHLATSTIRITLLETQPVLPLRSPSRISTLRNRIAGFGVLISSVSSTIRTSVPAATPPH